MEISTAPINSDPVRNLTKIKITKTLNKIISILSARAENFPKSRDKRMSDEDKKPLLPRSVKQEPETQSSETESESSVAEIYWTDQTNDSLELTDSSSRDSMNSTEALAAAAGVEIVSDEIIAHRSQDMANLNIRGSR